jgi:thiol-disulfide isomerase/thioredoxin
MNSITTLAWLLLLLSTQISAFVPVIINTPNNQGTPTLSTVVSQQFLYRSGNDEDNTGNSGDMNHGSTWGLLSTRSKEKTKPRPSLVTEIGSYVEWQAMLEDSEDDPHPITIVKFHSEYCKSCQKFGQLFEHTARKLQQQQSQVHMVAMEFGHHKQLCKTLGIRELPTVQMYQGGRLLSSFTCPPSRYHLVEQALEHLGVTTLSSSSPRVAAP